MTSATPKTTPVTEMGIEDRDLVERLRVHARVASEAHRMMAEAKTARQTDREGAWTDAGYGWVQPEQSEGIKRMLAERGALAASRETLGKESARWQNLATEALAMVDKAAPFMDEGFSGTGWKPSEKLKLLYFAAATCDRVEAGKDALLFVLDMLKRARALYVAGCIPDPWNENPFRREDIAQTPSEGL